MVIILDGSAIDILIVFTIINNVANIYCIVFLNPIMVCEFESIIRMYYFVIGCWDIAIFLTLYLTHVSPNSTECLGTWSVMPTPRFIRPILRLGEASCALLKFNWATLRGFYPRHPFEAYFLLFQPILRSHCLSSLKSHPKLISMACLAMNDHLIDRKMK